MDALLVVVSPEMEHVTISNIPNNKGTHLEFPFVARSSQLVSPRPRFLLQPAMRGIMHAPVVASPRSRINQRSEIQLDNP